MKTYLLPLFAAILLTSTVNAQSDVPFHCGADELWRMGADAMNDPTLVDRIAQSDQELEEFTRTFVADGARGGGGFVIPIVFHIVHNNGPENIGDAQILDAVRILNEDFNRMNPDWDNVRSEFQSLVADVGIEFRLAGKDPNGNCTNGITRTVSSLTNEGSDGMKALIQWPRNKYLNVWVAASANGAAGYTYRPASAQWNAAADGIVLQHIYTGSIGTGSASRSRALSHEVGHWINLKHTWGDGNTPALASNCDMDDDVSDTPLTVGWTTCSLSGSSCGSLDNVENYMDYSYCSKMFTTGQATRMIAGLNSSTAQRNQLITVGNLISTGTNGNAPICAARFSNTSPRICAGGTVSFTDLSYNNVSGWNWTFPGGTPATSNQQNPTVTYAAPGIYAVTLSANNGSSSVSTTSNNLVEVAGNPGQAAPLVEGFEGAPSLPERAWSVLNVNGDNGFSLTNAAGYTGSSSVRLLNTASMTGTTDELITPTIDMTNATDIAVSFRYAYARRNSSNDDLLRIYVSNTCGDSWSLRKQIRGSSDLNTGGIVSSGSFVPNGPAQWGFAEITTISSAYHVPNFRVRFEFLSEGGNNLYIDDVNINGLPVGLEEVLAGSGPSLVVYPNPSAGQAQVVLNLSNGGKVRMDLLDVLGRTISGLHDGDLPAGVRRFDLPVSELPAGLYFVRLLQNGRNEVVRFTVQ